MKDRKDRLREDMFRAAKEELRNRGYDLNAVDQLLQEFSWFMSPISALRTLLKSHVTVEQYRNSLVFLSNRHEQLAEMIPSNSKVLDVGSGLGLLAVALAEKSCIVHGTEISADNIQIAQRLAKLRKVSNHCTFHKVQTCKLPFAPKSFEFAVLSWTLHDITDDDQEMLLSECSRVLRPAGKLIIVDQEGKLNFSHAQEMLEKRNLKKIKDRIMTAVFNHNTTSKARLIQYEKTA